MRSDSLAQPFALAHLQIVNRSAAADQSSIETLSSVAVLEFLPAAAVARVITANLGGLSYYLLHRFRHSAHAIRASHASIAAGHCRFQRCFRNGRKPHTGCIGMRKT